MAEKDTLTWRSYCMTLTMLAANIFGFMLCTMIGEIVYNVGSMNAERILVDRQYYRLILSMFLHADIEHIVSNMIFLAGLGKMIEQAVGHVRFCILYLISGLGAGVLSMIYSVLTGNIYNAVGASGAIFGLVGALFYTCNFSQWKFWKCFDWQASFCSCVYDLFRNQCCKS